MRRLYTKGRIVAPSVYTAVHVHHTSRPLQYCSSNILILLLWRRAWRQMQCIPTARRCLTQLQHHAHTCRSWRCLTSSSDRLISGTFSFIDCFTLSMLLSISLYLLHEHHHAQTRVRSSESECQLKTYEGPRIWTRVTSYTLLPTFHWRLLSTAVSRPHAAHDDDGTIQRLKVETKNCLQ